MLITSTVFKIMPDIELGDVIVYHHPAQDHRKYYGIVIEEGGEHLDTLTNPAQWIRVRWMGLRPFREDNDLINKTTNLVTKYDNKE